MNTKKEDIMVELTRRKWWWVGHILRKDMGNIMKEALFWTPDGKKKPEGKTQNNLEKDCGKGAGVSSSVLEWGPTGEALWRPYAQARQGQVMMIPNASKKYVPI